MKYIIRLELVVDSDDYPEGEIECIEDARDKGHETIIESAYIKGRLEVFDEHEKELMIIW